MESWPCFSTIVLLTRVFDALVFVHLTKLYSYLGARLRYDVFNQSSHRLSNESLSCKCCCGRCLFRAEIIYSFDLAAFKHLAIIVLIEIRIGYKKKN